MTNGASTMTNVDKKKQKTKNWKKILGNTWILYMEKTSFIVNSNQR